MRIVTWNVNSLTKTAPEAFPVAELAGAGYGAVHDSGGRWAGVAILARAGMCGIDREYRKGPKPSDHAPLMLDLAGADNDEMPQRFFTNVYALARSLTSWRAYW